MTVFGITERKLRETQWGAPSIGIMMSMRFIIRFPKKKYLECQRKKLIIY